MIEHEHDVDLVGRIALGDGTKAEAEMCRRFAPRIRLYGLRHLRSDERARDLVQAVLLAVLQAARSGRIENPQHLDRFVLGTCRNIAHRFRETEDRFVSIDDANVNLGLPLPELELLDRGALMRCLSRLDERARTVMWLTFNEERAPQEIAAALKTTLGNVRILRHRAMRDLRKCMGATP